MKLNAVKNTVTIPLSDLANVQMQLDRLQRVVQGIYEHRTSLTDTEISMDAIKDIRETLNLAGGVIKVSKTD